MNNCLFLNHQLKKYSFYLTRGAKLSKVTKKTDRILERMKNDILISCAKRYQNVILHSHFFLKKSKKEMLKLGAKHFDRKVVNKYLSLNSTRFKGEEMFQNPSSTIRVTKYKNKTVLKIPNNWFGEGQSIEKLKDVQNKINWPAITIDESYFKKTDQPNLPSVISNILVQQGISRQQSIDHLDRQNFKKEIEYFVLKNEPIRISYYLFCGKIGNPFKVYYQKPRLSDYYGLKKIIEIEKTIRQIYQPKGYKYAVEWFIIDQTRIQRFDIPPGQEISTRKIYKRFIKLLNAEEYIHLIPWETLIPNLEQFEKLVNKLQKEYIKSYFKTCSSEPLNNIEKLRGEKMHSRLRSGYTIVNPCLIPQGKLHLQDILVIYNDIFPGLHSHIPIKTPYQKYLEEWVKKQSIKESAEYFATLDARYQIKNYGQSLPKTIKATITNKPGRFVLDYLGNGRFAGTRFFPDVGEPVILNNEELHILPFITILSYPKRFIPIYIKEIDHKSPFFWYCTKPFKTISKDIFIQ